MHVIFAKNVALNMKRSIGVKVRHVAVSNVALWIVHSPRQVQFLLIWIHKQQLSDFPSVFASRSIKM